MNSVGQHELPQWRGEPALLGVFLDAGLTLVRARTPLADILREVAGDTAHDGVEGELLRVPRLVQRHLDERWHDESTWLTEKGVRKLFVEAYTDALAEQPMLTRERAQEIANQSYDAYQDPKHWAAFDDVTPALEALRERDIVTGVISDWGHGLEAILLELELGHLLDFMVVSSRMRVSKPDPHVFNLALARAGLRPANAIHIGDSYKKDVLGARAAGISGILLDRTRQFGATSGSTGGLELRDGTLPAADCPVVRSLLEMLPLVGVEQS